MKAVFLAVAISIIIGAVIVFVPDIVRRFRKKRGGAA